jgi:hypothetical protein
MTRLLQKIARVDADCAKCGKLIAPKDKYYTQEARFLQSLHDKPKKYCATCYAQYGDNVIYQK